MKTSPIPRLNTSGCTLSLALAISAFLCGCSRQSPEEKRAEVLTLTTRGDVLEDAHDPAGALEQYLKAEKISSDDPALQSRIAKTASDLGKTDLALNAVRNLERLYPPAKTNGNVVQLREQLEALRKSGKSAVVTVAGVPPSEVGKDAPTVTDASMAAPSGPSTLAALELRIKRLEEQLKNLPAGGTNLTANSITTRELKIVDENDHACVVLTVDSDGGNIQCLDRKGVIGAYIAQSEVGGLLVLNNQQGRTVLIAGVKDGGLGGFLTTQSSSGKVLTGLSIGGASGLVFVNDKDGNAMLQLGQGDDGRGIVFSANSAGSSHGLRWPSKQSQ